jgi:WD40 repeat protein/predicted Ser/Thr protein kinase
MDTRCPSCDGPIELPTAPTDVLQTISSVECPNCGLVPFQFGNSTIAYAAPREGHETIAHFELVRLLGQGGFGSVWLANDLNLGRQVALKVAARADRDTNTLLHEAQSAAMLKHSNIVSVYEVGSEDGRVYIASEFIDGLNLRDMLTTGKPNVARAVEWTLAVARALQHAHEHGVVHRDIKPSNIMLDAHGQPFVADFGLAKRIAGDASISAEGQILGTALYMSPEQAGGKSALVDGRSDLYALGVTLFEMLTGHVPFRGNVQAVLHQKIREDAPSPRTLNPKVPRDLETICLKCLERDPDKRYRSARDLADELERFRSGSPIKARPVSSLEKTWRWCLRHRVVASLAAGLIFTLTAGLIGVSYFWMQSAENARLANRRLYRSEMNLAAQYLVSGDVQGVKRTLERIERDRQLSELRDFAWHYHKTAIAPFLQVSNQGDPVIDVAVFPDGRYYAACGRKQIHVWDARTGELVRTLSLDVGRFQSIAVSPASGRLASGSTDGRVRLWSPLAHDREILVIKHGPPVAFVRFSANGKRLLSAGKMGAVRIWDVENEKTTEPIQIPTGQSGTRDVRFFPDGKSIAVATRDGHIRLWNVEGRTLIRLLGPTPFIESLAVSDDGGTLAAGTRSGQVHLWSVPDGELIGSHQAALGAIGDLEFLKGASLLAMTTIGGRLLIYDVDQRREIHTARTHLLSFGVLAHSAGGKVLAVGGGDGSVKLLRVAEIVRPIVFWIDKGKDVDPGDGPSKRETQDRPVRGVALLPDGKRLIAASAGGALAVWNTRTAESTAFPAVQNVRITSIALQPAGSLVAVACAGTTVLLLDHQTLKLVRKLELSQPGAPAITFSPSGRKLVVAGSTGNLAVFDSSDWSKPQFEATPRDSRVNAVLYSPRERDVVLAYEDGTVLFVNAATGEPRDRTIQVPTIPLAMSWCQSGNVLAVGTATGELQLHDAADGRALRNIRAHASRVNVLTAFPDGRTLVTAGRDNDLKLWDAASGELITTLHGHHRQIFCIGVSADGKSIASGGLEGDIRLWRSAGP